MAPLQYDVRKGLTSVTSLQIKYLRVNKSLTGVNTNVQVIECKLFKC
jgi:hypothetical protein